jgi:hypothetical protein
MNNDSLKLASERMNNDSLKLAREDLNSLLESEKRRFSYHRAKTLKEVMTTLEGLSGLDEIVERFQSLQAHIENAKTLGLEMDSHKIQRHLSRQSGHRLV